jgi:hypothetical protein
MKSESSPSVIELLDQLKTLFEDVQYKAEARDKAGAAYQEAVKAHEAAASALGDLQAQLNAMLGLVKTDPRVRVSA